MQIYLYIAQLIAQQHNIVTNAVYSLVPICVEFMTLVILSSTHFLTNKCLLRTMMIYAILKDEMHWTAKEIILIKQLQ